MAQVVLIQLFDHLAHLLLLPLGAPVHIHRSVHEVAQRKESLVFLCTYLHIAFAVGQNAVDHCGDAGRFGPAQHSRALFGQNIRVQHPGTNGILDIMVHKGDLVGHAHDASLRRCRPRSLGVGHDAVAHLPCQVQAPSVLFQPVHHTQALHIVLEAIRAELVQRLFTRMAKGRMPQIMGQTDGLGQILVEPQGPGNGTGDL